MRSAAAKLGAVCLLLAAYAFTSTSLAAPSGTPPKQTRRAITNLIDFTDRVVRVRTLTGVRIDAEASGQLVYDYSYGTGVLLAERGLVVTAHHLVESRSALPEGEQEVAIMTRSSATYLPVDVVAEDVESDLAVLRANRRAVPRDRYFIPNADVSPVVGEDAYVLGIRAAAPADSFEVGVIAGRFVEGDAQLIEVGGDSYHDQPWISVSQKILPGYSGGAIVDADGAWVAIIVGAPFHEDEWADFSFGISVTALATLLEERE